MAGPAEARDAEVWARLGRVTDPELDEPVTELGFVTAVGVDEDGAVEVGFRLPTYWCAANFAYMMADDMRREVAALPWVTAVRLVLDEHMYAETVNRAMADGLSFRVAFGDEASGDELAEVRRVFAVKAFQRRQEAVLRHMLGAGFAAETLVAITVRELAALCSDTTGQRLATRYLEKRDVAGRAHAGALAFVDEQGAALAAEALPARLRTLRRVGINAEFNGALCRGLLRERYGESRTSLRWRADIAGFHPPRAGRNRHAELSTADRGRHRG